MPKAKKEEVKQKSPAEFFAENQIIAGFDNPGKSLYTSIRELVENSLDAAESIGVLPDISVEITELSEVQFNKRRGVSNVRDDAGLFRTGSTGSKKKSAAPKNAEVEGMDEEDPFPAATAASSSSSSSSSALSAKGVKGAAGKAKGEAGGRAKVMYYQVTCRDNGCGLPHNSIPDMLGRVLSGSKYGVRQTRGKFGLGAKMALIWSKKSTGMPIEIRTAHATDPKVTPANVSHCILDIDIYKNAPKVELHEKEKNSDGWRGAEITITVGGNWTTYSGKIKNYFQQLAVITPYASLQLRFTGAADGGESSDKRNLEVHFERRSTQLPDLPSEVKHHPSSVDNLLVSQLLSTTRTANLANFLQKELQGVSAPVAARVVAELGEWASELTPAGVALSAQKVTALTQVLRDVTLFKPPDGKCLSPAGEYNLRLGIQKEVDPVLVATYTMPKAAAHDGHAFIVEAGVSLGGPATKEGISVYRFANRIPLLFEAGSDVATRVANRKIKWASYKIDQKRDKVGIFVSLVSTKIPFKGTSKEYIGEDIEPIADAVRKALMQCGSQLKHHIVRREAVNDAQNRRKHLIKYVPDVTKALYGVLQKVYDRDGAALGSSKSDSSSSSGKKRSRNSLDESGATADANWSASKRTLLNAVHKKELTAKTISDILTSQAGAMDEQAMAKEKVKSGRGDGTVRKVFIAPLPNEDGAPEGKYAASSWDKAPPPTPPGTRPSMFLPELQHPAFSIRLLRGALYNP